MNEIGNIKCIEMNKFVFDIMYKKCVCLCWIKRTNTWATEEFWDGLKPFESLLVFATCPVLTRACGQDEETPLSCLFFLYCILCNFMCEQVNMPRSKPAPDRLPSVAGPMLWTMTGFTSREQGFADQDFLAFSRIHVTVCHLPNKISSQQCKMDAQVLGNCTKAIWLADFSSLECARALLWYQRAYTVPYCISSPPTQIGQSSSSTRK